MNRHTSLGSIGLSLLVGMIAGAAAVTVLGDPRSTKRCARRTLHSVEGLLDDLRDRIF